jgi:hypothetical protein
MVEIIGRVRFKAKVKNLGNHGEEVDKGIVFS